MWVRGLKLLLIRPQFQTSGVAPRVGAWIETSLSCPMLLPVFVAPRVGAWIETIMDYKNDIQDNVAPRVGAWIETSLAAVDALSRKSHPVWVRGLKLEVTLSNNSDYVAPRVGAWIETLDALSHHADKQVAPRVGAWIETKL